MSRDERLTTAKDQLDLVLGFFGRVETKLSVVFGTDVAMIGFLATRFPQIRTIQAAAWIAAGLFLTLIGLSLWKLYQGSFPQLAGGSQSLVYFREIAKRTEVQFVAEFSGATPESLAKDLLGQVWRNAQILSEKFDYLVWAYRLMALSVIPWAIAIVVFAQ